MSFAERLDLLLPPAAVASKTSPLSRYVPPLVTGLWQEMPLDEPVPVRCAWVESEIMRRVPLGLSRGELLGGRIDLEARVPEARPVKLPPDMYSAGQKGHTALDAEKLLRVGIVGVEEEIRERIASAKDDDARVFYRSCLISLEGFRALGERLRVVAAELAAKGDAEMGRLALVLERVPYHPARTFHEAIQATHLLYFAATLTSQALYGPGRIDRVLLPYYHHDLYEGLITREGALELICCQFILTNYVFNTPQPVMTGGLGADGRDSANELTYLCLEADRLVGLVNPSLALGVNEGTPQDLLDKAAEALLAGSTKPSLFNDRTITSGLQKLGASFEDATEYIHSTCVEITMVGRSNILVASPYINLLKPLEFMLSDGKPMRGDEDRNDVNGFTRLAPPGLGAYASYEEFAAEYKRQLAGKIEDAAVGMQHVRRGRASGWAFPLASCFTDDCLERGLDMDRGGARYTWTETSNVGLANIVDSLMVIKRRVFEEKRFAIEQVRDILLGDYAKERERLDLIDGVPRYGNDNPEADSLAGSIVETIYGEHYKHRDGLGGWFVPGFFCWIMHRILGEKTAASPDGRRAGEVLADAAGAAQGRDRSGPTAAVKSITSWDHEPGLGGIVLNLRFSPQAFPDKARRRKLIDLIRTYFDLGGFEIQINAVDSQVLGEAQREPEKHADLLVRVAGYSDYFTLLDPKMQDEIIRRTEHSA